MHKVSYPNDTSFVNGWEIINSYHFKTKNDLNYSLDSLYITKQINSDSIFIYVGGGKIADEIVLIDTVKMDSLKFNYLIEFEKVTNDYKISAHRQFLNGKTLKLIRNDELAAYVNIKCVPESFYVVLVLESGTQRIWVMHRNGILTFN